jgi:hypothetical protein
MDAGSFRESIESAKATELNRLGSQKLLLALTDAELDRATVLRVAADSENAARNTFEAWAGDENDPAAREAFAQVAAEEAEHYDRVLSAMDEETREAYDPADGGTLHSYLRGRGDAVERVAAGLVARGIVASKTHLQLISFFVNEQDEARANLFRELRTETEDRIDEGLDLLDALCATDEDWERAHAVAEYVVQVSYDDYADSLEGMGLDPKPIC